MARGLAFRRQMKRIKVTEKYRNVNCKCDYCKPNAKTERVDKATTKHKKQVALW